MLGVVHLCICICIYTCICICEFVYLCICVYGGPSEAHLRRCSVLLCNREPQTALLITLLFFNVLQHYLYTVHCTLYSQPEYMQVEHLSGRVEHHLVLLCICCTAFLPKPSILHCVAIMHLGRSSVRKLQAV